MRAAVLLPGLLFVLGCGARSSPNTLEAEATTHIQELANAKNESDRELAQDSLYGCGPAAVEPIRRALADRSQPQPALLIAILSAIPDDRVPGILLGHLRSPSREIRRQALYGLSLRRSLANVAPILDLVNREDPGDREWSLYTLREIGGPLPPALLRKALADESAYVRAQAAAGLRFALQTADLPRVLPLLSDSDSTVRTEAALSILRADNRSVPARKCLQEQVRQLQAGSLADRQKAIHIACLAPKSIAERVLLGELRHPDPRIRAEAAWALGRLDGTTTPDALLRSAKTDPDVKVRQAALESMCRLAFPNGPTSLQLFLTGREFRTSQVGATTLAQCPNVPVWVLLEMLDSRSSLISRRAAAALVQRGVYRPKTPALLDAAFADTDSSDKPTRRTALQVLAALPMPAARRRIDELLSHPDPVTRLMAMSAIKERIGMKRTLPRTLVHPLPSWFEPPR